MNRLETRFRIDGSPEKQRESLNQGWEQVNYLKKFVSCQSAKASLSPSGFLIVEEELSRLPFKGWAALIRKVYEVDPMFCVDELGWKFKPIPDASQAPGGKGNYHSLVAFHGYLQRRTADHLLPV